MSWGGQALVSPRPAAAGDTGRRDGKVLGGILVPSGLAGQCIGHKVQQSFSGSPHALWTPPAWGGTGGSGSTVAGDAEVSAALG